MKTDASEAEPLLAIYLRLDLGMAADLMLQLDERDALASTQPRGMATTQLDATLSQSVLRFLQAMLNSLDAEILGPALVREIYFRVFMGEQGGSMRAALNRNKRSLAIDLKTDAGRQAIRKMARQADVIIENFRPGVMNTLGLHYASLEAANRKFVYCSISAFGQTGASRNRPGVDGIIQAVSGLVSTLGEPGSEPLKVPVPVADMVGGYMASIAVLAALHEVRCGLPGQHLDVSLFNAAIMLQQVGFTSFLASGIDPEKVGSAAP